LYGCHENTNTWVYEYIRTQMSIELSVGRHDYTSIYYSRKNEGGTLSISLELDGGEGALLSAKSIDDGKSGVLKIVPTSHSSPVTHHWTKIYIHTYTYMHTYIHTHAYIHTYTYTYIHTYIHYNIHTTYYIHTYIHTHIHTYIHTYIPIHNSFLTTYIRIQIHKHTDIYIHTHWVALPFFRNLSMSIWMCKYV